MGYIAHGNLSVDSALLTFINDTLLPEAGKDEASFWTGFDEAVHQLAPRNAELLGRRETLQNELDNWLKKRRKSGFDEAAYTNFLREIGYIVDEGDDFVISTEHVDAEIATIAGPQLVVPVMNARYALNAANARWGSLYDALYGTDVIAEENGLEKGTGYNPARGAAVIAKARALLDERVPLTSGSWTDITSLSCVDGVLKMMTPNVETTLQISEQFAGYSGKPENPTSVLLKKNGLHIDLQINPDGQIGKTDQAGINDIVLESALSTIMDCEDSVAAVDGEDKVLAYKNWLGLMTGNLSVEMQKGGKTFTRSLNADREYTAPDGTALCLHGRSLMLVRNVGHLMTNPAILLKDGSEIPEGILDAFMTVLGALPDLERKGNSRTGSVYIVKPKMHGPEEVSFACDIFTAVEASWDCQKTQSKLALWMKSDAQQSI